MSDDNYIFDVPADFSLRDLRLRVQGKHSLVEDPVQRVGRDYLDTFDWRLFRSGSVLEMTSEQKGHRMIWRHLNGGRVILTQIARGIPRFSTDCNTPGICQRLQSVVRNRALQSKVPVASEVHTLRLLDGEAKTVLLLELRKDQISLPNSTKQISLPPRLYLFSYRGYEKATTRIRQRLTSKGGLRPAKEDPLFCALKAVGVEAGGYTNRPRVAIDPRQPVHAAAREILGRLLEVMQENLEGACQNLDPEFLHDFRRALTRTAMLVDRLPEAFPADRMSLIREEFAWLDMSSRPTRQMDVYLLLFEGYKSRLPAALQPYLGPFQEYLKDHKALEQRKLCVVLQSPRYLRLIEDWRRQLADRPTTKAANRPVGERARELIWDSYLAVLRRGSSITGQAPADEVVKVHMRTKELGFLLEIFGGLFPEKKLSALVRPLSRLERNLEEFEDLELQQLRLKKYCKEMKEEQRLTQASLEAMDHLIKDMAEQEISVRKVFAGRFAKFSDKKVRSRYQALFGPKAELPERVA